MLQIDETTKKVFLVTLLISTNCIHKLIGFVSCLQNLMHKYIVFSSLGHQQINVFLMTDSPYVVNIPVGSGTTLSFMTLNCTMLSCG